MFGSSRKPSHDSYHPTDPASLPAVQRRVSLAVARLQAEVVIKYATAQAEAEAIGKLTLASLGHEVATLNYGESLASGRRAVLELTARKVSQQAAINDRNLMRWSS